ncbi:ATP-dependent helicase rhp16-like [Lotus japonicus]|uniref:ATP-dependent helicase rhp16-like n=1 Tax=Lotus japonicus TaxID=34305 RepID=UPI0025826AB4|nr:ATP-dependent helicase rhp16-like [Lotus japonicus]
MEVPPPNDDQNRRRGRKKIPKPLLLWQQWESEDRKFVEEKMREEEQDSAGNGKEELTVETAEPSSDLTVPLLRYQKEWLAWGLNQENSPVRGGILADEMGMGKTIQAIALVLAKRQELRQTGREIEDEWVPSTSGSFATWLPAIKGTLVVCPPVAVSQWVNEIDRFTVKGSTKVLVYHGANRVKSRDQFSEFDFVITTYSIVQSQYKKAMSECLCCGNMFLEPNSRQDHVCRPHVRAENPPLLHAVMWQRIILDEAHYIKAIHGSTTKAVLALESSYKWALSGTPLQNNVGELYSLVRFLQVTPYAYLLCKDCDCKILEKKRNEKCSKCSHGTSRHFSWWIKLNRNRGSMLLVKHKILKNIMLRRTKIGRAADLAFPEKIISVRRVYLDVKEQDYYKSTCIECLKSVNTYVEANIVMNHYADIFGLLTKLRQAVDHPYLVVYSKPEALKGAGVAASDGTVEQVCGICDEPVEDPVVTSCEHVFCNACLVDFSASMDPVLCPSCSLPITVEITSSKDVSGKSNDTAIKGFRSSSILYKIELENFQTSTKIEALREEIYFMIQRDGSAKGIVFSQFTSFLDLINYSLVKSGVSCVQLNGSMSLTARDAAIKRFNDDPDCRIFLLSLKAAGVALNLTVASHVFLMEPWWNPGVEQQAQDRIHRIGQNKPIRVVKFITENTIEERILKLQQQKEAVSEGLIDGSSEALGRLKLSEMINLFGF